MNGEEGRSVPRDMGTEPAIMKQQPGFAAQLQCGIAGSCVFINYTILESTEHFRKAVSNPRFQSMLEEFPTSAVASP